MFSLQVIVGPGIAWHFLFRGKEAAEDVMNSVAGDSIQIHIADDFGNEALFPRSELRGCLLEDLDLSRGAQLERIMNEQRTRAKAQQLMQADPMLRQMNTSNVPVQMPMMGTGR